MSVAAPKPEPSARSLIYRVEPETEAETWSPAGLWPALVARVLLTLAVLAAAAGGASIIIWLVLTPVLPDGAAGRQLWQPWPSQMLAPAPERPAAPTTALPASGTTQPAERNRMAGDRRRSEQLPGAVVEPAHQ